MGGGSGGKNLFLADCVTRDVNPLLPSALPLLKPSYAYWNIQCVRVCVYVCIHIYKYTFSYSYLYTAGHTYCPPIHIHLNARNSLLLGLLLWKILISRSTPICSFLFIGDSAMIVLQVVQLSNKTWVEVVGR